MEFTKVIFVSFTYPKIPWGYLTYNGEVASLFPRRHDFA